MFDSDDDKIKKLPVKFKMPAPPDRVLLSPYEVGKSACLHMTEMGASYIVDDSLDTVECSLCHERLNPMFVMKRLAAADNRIHEAHKRYHEEMQRLKERSRTKCEHCDKMTRISRN